MREFAIELAAHEHHATEGLRNSKVFESVDHLIVTTGYASPRPWGHDLPTNARPRRIKYPS